MKEEEKILKLTKNPNSQTRVGCGLLGVFGSIIGFRKSLEIKTLEFPLGCDLLGGNLEGRINGRKVVRLWGFGFQVIFFEWVSRDFDGGRASVFRQDSLHGDVTRVIGDMALDGSGIETEEGKQVKDGGVEVSKWRL